MKDNFLLVLGFISVIVVGIVSLMLIPDIHAGLVILGNEINEAFIIIFFTVLGLGGAAVVVKIWQSTRVQIVRDLKDGQVSRAIVYKGKVMQIGSAEGIGLQELLQMQMQLISQQEKTLRVVDSGAKTIQHLLPLLEEYEVEEEEEEEPLQIEAPEEETIHLSTGYRPHANVFLARRKLVVGISGSGKSNTTAVIAEEMGRLNVPLILADTENEYESLCDKRYLPNGMLVDSRKINTDNASQFGAYVLENNVQAILNLQSFDMEEGAWIMINLIQGLKHWQEARANELRIPVEFLLEEATTWLPQNIKESPLYGEDVFNRLHDAFFNDMTRKGRKRGLGLTVICQKIGEIDKRVLQSEDKILHRQGEMIDLEKYKKWGISIEETLSLQNGECFFFSPEVSKLRLLVRKRHSQHGANTPDLGALRKYQKSGQSFPRSLESGSNFGQVETPTETASSLDLEPFTETLPLDEMPSVETRQISVSNEKRETIKRLADMGMAHRDIARAVALSGRKYHIYQQICKEEGINPHEGGED